MPEYCDLGWSESGKPHFRSETGRYGTRGIKVDFWERMRTFCHDISNHTIHEHDERDAVRSSGDREPLAESLGIRRNLQGRPQERAQSVLQPDDVPLSFGGMTTCREFLCLHVIGYLRKGDEDDRTRRVRADGIRCIRNPF